MGKQNRQERRRQQLALAKSQKKQHQYGRRLMVPPGHPALSTACEPVAPGEDVSRLVDQLIDATEAHANGVGLAAPQIGVTKRVVLLWPTRFAQPVLGRDRLFNAGNRLAMVNPRMTAHSPGKVPSTEGCLSYPGYEATFMRWQWLDVEYEDVVTREVKSIRCDGFAAFVAQHELDHLEGVCLVRQHRDGWRDPEYEKHLAAEQAAYAQRSNQLPDIGLSDETQAGKTGGGPVPRLRRRSHTSMLAASAAMMLALGGGFGKGPPR